MKACIILFLAIPSNDSTICSPLKQLDKIITSIFVPEKLKTHKTMFILCIFHQGCNQTGNKKYDS